MSSLGFAAWAHIRETIHPLRDTKMLCLGIKLQIQHIAFQFKSQRIRSFYISRKRKGTFHFLDYTEAWIAKYRNKSDRLCVLQFFVSSHRSKRCARLVVGPIVVTPHAWVQNCVQENLHETYVKAFAQCLLRCYHDSRKVAVS